MKLKRGYFLKNSVGIVCVSVSICCLLVVIVSVVRLPEVSTTNNGLSSLGLTEHSEVSEDDRIGKFGEMMIEMLPKDLAFTIFMPSQTAFERDLRLRVNDSLVAEKANDTYAVLTRILGFSVVPRKIYSENVPLGEEISYNSLCGFGLYFRKNVNGRLVVNRVESKGVYFRKGEIVVHIMNGVIMDAEFEESVQPDDDEED